MTRIIIIEDEFSPRQMLREKIESQFADMEIIGESESAEEALIEILRLRPDLIFLDIQMPGKDGLWLVGELLRLKTEAFTPPDVIFTTGYAYSEYLLKAFEVAAIDYLVKPISIASLEKAVARYRTNAAAGLQSLSQMLDSDQFLKFKGFKGIFLFRPDDIAYITADGDYACLFLANGSQEDIYERLGQIETRLPADTFLRTGKSTIVNVRYIRKITDTAVQIVTPQACYNVDLSRRAIQELKDRL